MSEEYLAELRKEELERQEHGLVSQYTDEERMDSNDYRNIVNANLICTPEKGESLAHYADRLQVYAKIGADKNRLKHIDGPRKAWYTHRSGSCFMCEDIALIAVMRRVIGLLAIKYPAYRF